MIWRKTKSRMISRYYSIVDVRVECLGWGDSFYLIFSLLSNTCQNCQT